MLYRKGLFAFFLFSSLFAGQVLASEDVSRSAPYKVKSAGVPAGFQFLLEKQTTAIDVFYGDVYITTTLASYTPTTVEFQNPDEVVSGLKNLITPEQVAKALSGEIDSHAGEVCRRDGETDCGVISPDSVGVIFDEGRFRADLFINPNLLSVQQVEFDRYLPASSSDFSSINNLTLLYSGQDAGESTTALSGLSYFSVREQRVVAAWDYADVSSFSGQQAQSSNSFNMEELYWQMDKTDFQYQAGWFTSDSRYLTFMPGVNLLGFRYSTSFKARTDLNFASGTPLQLYLPTRSRINIFKDGKFVSTGFYDPGNQTLDTSMLPDGAYDIELRIIDAVGREERVTRYYVKTQRLPPLDQDIYFIEAGDIRETLGASTLPGSLSTPLVQGGYSHRLSNELGLNLGASGTDHEVMTESGLYYLRDMFDLEPKVLLTTRGAYGWSLGGYARQDKWGAFYQARRLWSDADPSTTVFDQTNFTLPALRQYSVGVNYGVFDGNVGLDYSMSQRANDPKTDIVTLSYNRFFYVEASQLLFTSELSKTDSDKLVLFSLSWNFSKGRSLHTLTGTAIHQDNQFSTRDDLMRVAYGGSWYDNELRPEEISMQWNAEVDNERRILGASNDFRNEYGSSSFGVQAYENDVITGGTQSGYQYSGYLSTVVGGEKDIWGFGGRSGAQGALVIDVDTDVESQQGYDVFVNNALITQVAPGHKVVIPVAPYKTYSVRISDKNAEFVAFEDKTKFVTIYPGNVKALQWKGQSVGVLVGRVVRKIPGCFNDNDPECWAPLVTARAKNVNDFSATDSDGFIQAEVYRSAKSFTLMKKGTECKVDFSNVIFVDGLGYSDEDLKCRDMDVVQ